MAGRRITIDCILTKKKLWSTMVSVCLRKFANTASETHLWDGKGYVTLN